MVSHEVENRVVMLSAFREILSGVINDVICADGPDHFNAPRTAHSRDFRAKRLGDLHSERAHTSRGTIDQDPLSRLNPGLVAKTLQGGESRHGYGSRLFKRRVIRLHGQCRLGAACILGKGPTAAAEHLLPRLELSY